jgi:hypothetical protein
MATPCRTKRRLCIILILGLEWCVTNGTEAEEERTQKTKEDKKEDKKERAPKRPQDGGRGKRLYDVAAFVVQGEIESFGFLLVRNAKSNNDVDDLKKHEAD